MTKKQFKTLEVGDLLTSRLVSIDNPVQQIYIITAKQFGCYSVLNITTNKHGHADDHHVWYKISTWPKHNKH